MCPIIVLFIYFIIYYIYYTKFEKYIYLLMDKLECISTIRREIGVFRSHMFLHYLKTNKLVKLWSGRFKPNTICCERQFRLKATESRIPSWVIDHNPL